MDWGGMLLHVKGKRGNTLLSSVFEWNGLKLDLGVSLELCTLNELAKWPVLSHPILLRTLSGTDEPETQANWRHA